MSTISEVVKTLEQVLDGIDRAAQRLRESIEAWQEADALLQSALKGSLDSDVERLLAQFASASAALSRQHSLLIRMTTLVDNVIARLRGQAKTSEPESRPSPVFGTPEWIAEIGRRIDPSDTKVTTGIGFNDRGEEQVRLASGRDEVSTIAQERLTGSSQYPKPPGWRPGMLFTTAEHAETKHAVWMRVHSIRNLTVVINHPHLCGPPYGCEIAVRTLLPRGWTMTVVSSTSGRTWTLRGVAEA